MATPTSHPRPSPQKSANQANLTPGAASSPPASSSTPTNQRSNITSPAQASKKPLHYRNGSLQQMASPNASSTPMSRSGTQNGSTPMARTGTNGSVAMARTGTNNSSVGAARTPLAGRNGRTASTSTAAADSPALTISMDGVGKGSGFTPQGLGLTPFGLGGGVIGLAGMNPQDQEEERRRRLESIVQTIGNKACGMVSQQGVERCAKKANLECLWEEAMSLNEAKRILSIAGSGVLIEIEFSGDLIVEVGLSFPASKEEEDGVAKWASRGAEVLKNNLVGEKDAQSYVLMEDFAQNISQLATMDRLGGEEFSCFDAINGIYKCLDRVYRWELKATQFEMNRSTEAVVLSRRSGRPQMHPCNRIGLIIQYWEVQDHMDRPASPVDGENCLNGQNAVKAVSTTPWSLVIGCEAFSASLYSPIKISDQWVSKTVEKSRGEEIIEGHISNTEIDWLAVSTDASISNSPDARFVASFEPPVIVSFDLAMQIHDLVSSPLDPATCVPTSYESLLFAKSDLENRTSSATHTVDRTFVGLDHTTGGGHHKHRYVFYGQHQDYAHVMTEVPFGHPMQLINMLPNLRQWVLIGSLLRQCFTHTRLDGESLRSPANDAATNRVQAQEQPQFQTLDEELADFLSSPLSDDPASLDSLRQPLEVNIGFASTPIPRINVQFQNSKYGGKLASVAFSVGLNGIFEAIEVDDGRPPTTTTEQMDQATKENILLREKVRKILDIGRSIPLLVQWLTRA